MNKDIPIKIFFWMVMSWSAANLFAQAIYIGFNGVPFDGIAMVNSLGNWYYAVLAIEVAVWVYVAMFLENASFQESTSCANSSQPLKSIHCIKFFR